MEVSKDNIVLLIAYQRKAFRLLELGLNNKDVNHLLDQRPEQKKDLANIKPQLELSLQKNIARNKEIYKKAGMDSNLIFRNLRREDPASRRPTQRVHREAQRARVHHAVLRRQHRRPLLQAHRQRKQGLHERAQVIL